MIHHFSIPARDQVRVARVLAEILGGRDFPFSGPLPEARMAMAGDEHGTMIEVYPDTITIEPGKADEEQAQFVHGEAGRPHQAFHALISTPLSRAQIEAIGAREGWRTRFFGRGVPGRPPVFHLVEFWVENRIMLELAPADLLHEYTDFMQIAGIERAMAARKAAAPA